MGLRSLGYLLAIPQASPEQALCYQLGCIDTLVQWYSGLGPVCRLVLLPFIQSYWLHAARTQQLLFGTPAVAVPALQAAVTVPEPERIRAILSAACLGFRVDGADAVLQRLRNRSGSGSA